MASQFTKACELYKGEVSPLSRWICIWGVGHLDTPTVKCWISKAIGPNLMDQILKLRFRVQQKTIRYDLFVKPKSASLILSLLKSHKHLTGWHVIMHKPYLERPRPNNLKVISSCNGLASWNVNSLKRNRDEIAWFLKRKGIAIIALQETLHSDEWRMRIGKYQCIQSPMQHGEVGQRGVALAISPHLIAHETGSKSPFWVWARIIHPSFPSGLIVGSIYVISHRNKVRKEMIKGLEASIKSTLRRYPNSPVVMMGDWNMTSQELNDLLKDWRLPLTYLKCRGSARTRWKGKGSLRDLDHIVVSTNSYRAFAHMNVCRSWELSDHWPIMTYLKNEPLVPLYEGQVHNEHIPRIKTGAIKEFSSEIVHHNMWEGLSNEAYLDSEKGATLFINTSLDVAKEVGVINSDPPKKPSKRDRVHLSKKCKRLIISKQRAFTTWYNSRDLTEKEILWVKYLDHKMDSRELIRKEKKAQWEKFINEGANSLFNKEWKKAWRWIKCLGQRQHSHTLSLQPVRDKNGILQLDPDNISKAWVSHYSTLAKDVTGHSKDSTFWESPRDNEAEVISGLNDPITWNEANQALLTIKGGKAPGMDGLPPEWFKAMAESPKDIGVLPQSPMGLAFFKTIQGIWDKASVPEIWNKAVLVSIPKKGDLTYTDNYRGISLIGISLKLLCSIVASRIKNILEEKEILVKEQAGFRNREECMGQVATLLEVTQRRKICKLETYAAFIDFKKAYDTVPHEALLMKLRCIGIGGRTLDFIRSLYQNSKVAVKVGRDFSETFLLEKGLRQGCPLSPILFDIFINDILQGSDKFGIEVPGTSKHKLCGLMFADDIVLLAPDRIKLKRLIHQVEIWSNKWEMSVGANKCGIMVFGGDNNSLKDTIWTLQNEEVPIVDSYTYLGIELYNDLDLNKSSKVVSKRVNKALMSLKPALINNSIPMVVKVSMLKALILPIATYGGELFGMNQTLVRFSQPLINMGLQWILKGNRARGKNMGSTIMGLELGIAPLYTLFTRSRVRAWTKFKTLKTWIANLMEEPFKHRSSTWITGISKWLKRFQVGINREGETSSGLTKTVSKFTWSKILNKDSSLSLSQYRDKNFEDTREFIKLALPFTDLCKGIQWLVRLRTWTIWTGPRAANAGLISPYWKKNCPSCKETIQEDIPHILLECKRFKDSIREFIHPLLEKLVEQGSTFQREDLATLILGGQVNRVSSRHFWLGETMYSTEEEAPFLRVARFLQYVMPQRMGFLWNSQVPEDPSSELGIPISEDCDIPNQIVEDITHLAPDNRVKAQTGKATFLLG
jgi:exonuclease III